MKALHALRKAQHAAARSIGVFVQDVGRGLLEISHNTLALVGLAVVTALILPPAAPTSALSSKPARWTGCKVAMKSAPRCRVTCWWL